MAILSRLSESEFRELEGARTLSAQTNELNRKVQKLQNSGFSIPLSVLPPSKVGMQDGEWMCSIVSSRNLRLFTKQSGEVWAVDFKKLYEKQAPQLWEFDGTSILDDDVEIAGATPALVLKESDQPTDQKRWGIASVDGVFVMGPLADGGVGSGVVSSSSFLYATRGAGTELASLRLGQGLKATGQMVMYLPTSNRYALDVLTTASVRLFHVDTVGSEIEFIGLNALNFTAKAIDFDLIDNNASALSFDAAGKAGILEIVTTNTAEGVSMSGTLSVTGATTLGGNLDFNSGTIDLSTQTVDVTLNAAVDALNFDSNTLSIDASNNRVGIGTASPAVQFEVEKASAAPQIGLSRITDVTQSWYWWINANGHLVLQDNTAVTSPIVIEAGQPEPVLQIDTSGNVGIQETTPSKALDVKNGAAGGDILCYDIYTHDGGVHTSDERYKKSIKTSKLGLDFIKALNPISFTWKNQPEKKDGEQIYAKETYKRTHYGMTAQQVKETLDKLGISTDDFAGYIYEEDRDIYGLRYTEFIAPMIRAIQEQQVMIDELRARA